MKKPEINPKILRSLGLSNNEAIVFDVLLYQQMGRDVSAIASKASLPRTTVTYILRRLLERKLVEKVLHGRRWHWKYKRGLEFLIRRPISF
jgi:sugar-specific transcriptional regulator TrmB